MKCMFYTYEMHGHRTNDKMYAPRRMCHSHVMCSCLRLGLVTILHDKWTDVFGIYGALINSLFVGWFRANFRA